MKLAPLVYVCAMAMGCLEAPARHEPPPRGVQLDPKDGAADSFVEAVPGSTVKFTMRAVSIPDGGGNSKRLWFAETETTWDAYDVFYLHLDEQAAGVDVASAGHEGPDAITRPTLPYNPPDRGCGHGGYPAIGITFNAATKYCAWLSAKTGKPYRLPTHAEWLACGWDRPKTGTPPAAGWTSVNSGGTTHPVAQGIPNLYGLFDTIGNVAEWCSDGPEQSPLVCGGSFASEKQDLRPEGQRQSRDWQASDPSFPKSKWWLSDAPFVGFRVVCEEGPK
jgi:formylglycine-generating enzyme required for sulfatase activity